MAQLSKEAFIQVVREHQWADAWELMPRRLLAQREGIAGYMTAAEANELLSVIDSVPQDTTFESGTSGMFSVADLRKLFIEIFGVALGYQG